MKTSEFLTLKIAELETFHDFATHSGAQSRASALLLCREFLACPGAFSLRDFVRLAVLGQQQAVADAAGIRRATLSDYLAGRSSMTADNVERVLRCAVAKNGAQ